MTQIPGPAPQEPQGPPEPTQLLPSQQAALNFAKSFGAPDPIAAGDEKPSLFSQLLKADLQAEDSAMMRSFHEAMKTNPDLAGEAQRLSLESWDGDAEIGFTPDYVERNIDTVRGILHRRNAARRLRMGYSPVLARQLRDPEFAKLAQDDLLNLGLWEGVASAWKGSGLVIRANKIATRVRDGVATPAEREYLEELRAEMRELPAAEGFLAASTEFAGFYGRMIPEALEAATAGAFAGGLWGFAGGPAAPATVPAGIGTGALAGFSASMGIQMYQVEGGGSYLEMVHDFGIDPTIAAPISKAVGFANMMLEMVGFRAAVHPLKSAVLREVRRRALSETFGPSALAFGTRTLIDMGVSVAGESVTEGLQRGVTMVGTNIGLAATPFSKPLAGVGEILGQMVDETVHAAQGMVLIAGIPSVGSYMLDSHRARRAMRSGPQLANLMEGAAESKVRERNPVRFENYVAEATKDTPIENIYVDREMFLQAQEAAGVTPDELAAALPEVAEQLQATSDDVTISTARYATYLQGEGPLGELGDGLAAHRRTDPDGMSETEAKAFDKTREDLSKAAAETLTEETEAGREFAAQAAVVRDDYLKTVRAAGVSEQEAQAHATFYRDMVAVNAKEEGVMPREWSQQHGLTVKAATAPLESPELFEQTGERKTDTPEFKAFFGESKVVDEKGEPLVVYHGTAGKVFDRFDIEHPDRLDAGWLGRGIYFTKDPQEASEFAEAHAESQAPLDAAPSEFPLEHVIPAFVRITNPYSISAEEVEALRDTADESFSAAFTDGLIQQGYDGVIRGSELVAFSPEQIKSVNNRGTFDPTDPNILRQEEELQRGAFDPATDTAFLFEAQNASTLWHELFHYNLSQMERMVQLPDASERLVRDFDTMMKFVGVDGLDAWLALTPEQKREHHEVVATAGEKWLYEGRAPTLDDATVHLFERIKRWIHTAYKSIVRDLDAIHQSKFGKPLPALTDEVRQVFGRMVAAEDAVAEAEMVRSMRSQFAEKPEGMTDSDWVQLQALDEDAHEEAVAGFTRASLQTMALLGRGRSKIIREAQKTKAQLREPMKVEAEAQVGQEPIYRALRWLKTGEILEDDGTVTVETGPHKLRTALVKDLLIEPRTLKGDMAGLTHPEGVPPDVAASIFGFDSGGQMVEALASAPPMADVVDARTNARMITEHAELMDPAKFAEAVDRALHNESRARYIATVLRFLTKSKQPVRLLVKAARAEARAIMGRKTISEIKPHEHAMAEARAARQVMQAMASAKPEAATLAVLAQRRQLLQHELTKVAIEARETRDKFEKDSRKFNQPDKKLGKSRDTQIVGLGRVVLAAFGMRPAPSLTAAELVAKIETRNPPLAIEMAGVTSRATAGAKPYPDLSYDEMLDLKAAMDLLWFKSKREADIADGKQRINRARVLAELTAAFEAYGVPDRPGAHGRPSYMQGKALSLGSVRAAFRHTESWALQMDGGRPGAVHRYLFEILRQPFDDYLLERNDLLRTLRDSIKAIRKIDKGKGAIYVPELTYTFTDTIHMLGALSHAGNDSNLLKNIGGRSKDGWGDKVGDGPLDYDSTKWWAAFHRMAAKGIITQDHMDWVQMLWDTYEALKPRAQAAWFENYGYEFEEVEARPITVTFKSGVTKTYRGGYVPAAPDLEHPKYVARETGELSADGITEMSAETTGSRTSTGRGFGIERTGIVRPLDMTIARQARHLDLELRFIHLQRAGRDIASLLYDPKLKATINQIDPSALRQILLPWLADTLNNRVMAQGGVPWVNSLFVGLRRNTATALMFANPGNALQQPTGLATTLLYVPLKFVGPAAMEFSRGPFKMARKIVERSKFMMLRLREQIGQITDDKDLLLNPVWLLSEAQELTDRHKYFLQRLFQNPVDIISWAAAHDQAIAEGKTEIQAGSWADTVVRRSQGSGTAADISKFERSGAFVRMLGIFQTFWISGLNTVALQQGPAKIRAIAMMLSVIGVGGAAISQAFRGGWDDEDNDGAMLDDLLWWGVEETIGTAAAIGVPVAGPMIVRAMQGGYGRGRLSPGAVFSTAERAKDALRLPFELMGDAPREFKGRDILDVTTLLTLWMGVPWTALGKPASYLREIDRGAVIPLNPIDAARGFVTGAAARSSRVNR